MLDINYLYAYYISVIFKYCTRGEMRQSKDSLTIVTSIRKLSLFFLIVILFSSVILSGCGYKISIEPSQSTPAQIVPTSPQPVQAIPVPPSSASGSVSNMGVSFGKLEPDPAPPLIEYGWYLFGRPSLRVGDRLGFRINLKGGRAGHYRVYVCRNMAYVYTASDGKKEIQGGSNCVIQKSFYYDGISGHEQIEIITSLPENEVKTGTYQTYTAFLTSDKYSVWDIPEAEKLKVYY